MLPHSASWILSRVMISVWALLTLVSCADKPLLGPESVRLSCTGMLEEDPACQDDGGGEDSKKADANQRNTIRGILDAMSKDGICGDIYQAGMRVFEDNSREHSGSYWVWDERREDEGGRTVHGEYSRAFDEIRIWTGTDSWEKTVIHEAAHAAEFDDDIAVWAEDHCI